MINKLYISITIIIILHVVGILGINSNYQNIFLKLTPINLLISSIILLINQENKNKKFYQFFIFIFLFGYLIELIGVKSKLIFGTYEYGMTLGPKIFDIPIVMGLNWFNLIITIGIIVDKIKVHFFVKSLIAAFLMTSLDFLIEPVAIKMDFWHWKNNIIPLQNFIAWFIISFFLFILFYKISFIKKNESAFIFILIQFLFFGVLNLFSI